MIPEVRHELDGWALFWAELAAGQGEDDTLAAAVAGVVRGLRGGVRDAAELAGREPAASIRKLFRAAGCDPTRYRPSSEALARRVLRGDDFPRVNPFVDLNNLLSLAAVLPCCVMRAGALEPPLVLRRGQAGESMASLRGPFDLEGKPLLADSQGPFGTPITDAQRVAVAEGASEALLVVYAPAALHGDAAIVARLSALAAASAAARVGDTGWSG